MQNNRKQLFLFLCMSFLGFLFFASALLFLPLPESENQGWEGYHTILVEEGADLAHIETEILLSGFEEVVHYNNEMVEYFDYNGLASMRLADIPSRFEERDPRFDSYLLNLPSYFFTRAAGETYSIIYVKEKEHRIFSVFQCRQVLGSLPYDWRFFEGKPLFEYLLLLLYCVILLMVILPDRSKWPYLLAAGIPWIVFISLGGFFEFIEGALLLVTFSVFFRNYRPVFRFFLNHGYIDGGSGKAGFSLILFGMAVVAAFVLLFSSGPGFWMVIRFVCALLSMVFLFFSYNVATAYQRKRQQHRLFFRVPLAESGVDRVWIYHFCIFIILLFSPAAVNFHGHEELPSLPAPVAFKGIQDFSAEAIEELDRQKLMSMDTGSNTDLLPDVAEYLVHRAFQESFLLGREYVFPHVGERVGISSFSSEEASGVERNYKEMLVFSHDWFDRLLGTEQQSGLLGLWLSQGNPVGSVMIRQENFTISAAVLFRHIVVCLIICLPIFFMNNRLTPQLMYGIKSLTQRRKRQAA